MFSKTGKRIYATLMIISAALIILIILPSIFMFTDMLTKTFETTARRKLDRSFSSSRTYVDSILSVTDNLAYNPEIINTVSGRQSGTLTSVLDGARTYSQYINAITVYGTDGRIYTSSGVLDPPVLQDLMLDESISAFFADAYSEDFVSMRTSHIIKMYDGSPYDEKQGIISCCRKIYDGGEVTGYIFSDIIPQSLFSYFDYTNDPRLKNCAVMVTFNGGYFASAYSEKIIECLNSPNGSFKNGRLSLTGMRNFYGGTIRIAVPVATLYTATAIIGAVLVCTGAALMVFAHFCARRTARSVTGRLDGLLEKMTSSADRFA